MLAFVYLNIQLHKYIYIYIIMYILQRVLGYLVADTWLPLWLKPFEQPWSWHHLTNELLTLTPSVLAPHVWNHQDSRTV